MEESRLKGHCAHCKFKSFLFTKLNREELVYLNETREELSYQSGEFIIRQGQMINEFLYLQKGLIKLVHCIDGERDRIMSISRPMNFVSLISTFSSEQYPYSVIALEPSVVCSIELSRMKKIIKNNGAFALHLLSQISKSSDYILKSAYDIDNRHLRGRIAHILLSFSQDIYQGNKFLLPISRKEIGELINMSTENVIRILSEFRKDGIIDINGKEITIKNEDLLSKLNLHG